jgi:aspartyl-tRNA(Asn)/glutamyl-tRNA(Gln) amidotransferase subunit A
LSGRRRGRGHSTAVAACAFNCGLPLGLQLIGKPWGEAELLDAAYAVERAAGFAAKPERWW